MEFEDNHNCSSNVVPSMDSNVDSNISSSMGSKGNDEFPLRGHRGTTSSPNRRRTSASCYA